MCLWDIDEQPVCLVIQLSGSILHQTPNVHALVLGSGHCGGCWTICMMVLHRGNLSGILLRKMRMWEELCLALAWPGRYHVSSCRMSFVVWNNLADCAHSTYGHTTTIHGWNQNKLGEDDARGCCWVSQVHRPFPSQQHKLTRILFARLWWYVVHHPT